MQGTATGEGEGKRSPRKLAGAVTGLAHVKNPISAARAVMEMPDQRHVMLAGEGAEWVVLSEENRKRYDIERVSNIYFWTSRRLRQIRKAVGVADVAVASPTNIQAAVRRQSPISEYYFGTVGAVACDANNRIVAGSSTGGLTDKLPGRIGDTPIIGAGTYADDRTCGVSCTGTGEVFIRNVVAHDVAARMLYGKLPVREATRQTISELPDEEGGVGGLIALDKDGNHAFSMSARSVGMYRGYVTDAGEIFVGIFANESEKRIDKK